VKAFTKIKEYQFNEFWTTGKGGDAPPPSTPSFGGMHPPSTPSFLLKKQPLVIILQARFG